MMGGNVIADQGIAFASDHAGDRVVAFDRDLDPLVWSRAMFRGDRPGRLALDGDGGLYVANLGSGAVVALRAGTGEFLWRSEVCGGARGIDVGDDAIWVGCSDGTIARVDSVDGTILDTRNLGRDLGDVVWTPQAVYAVSMRTATVLVLDHSGALLEELRSPPVRLAAPDGGEERTFTARVPHRLIALEQGGVLLLHQRHLELAIGDGDLVGGPDGGENWWNATCEGVTHPALTWWTGSQVLTSPPLPIDVPLDVMMDGQDGVRVLSLNDARTNDLVFPLQGLVPEPIGCLQAEAAFGWESDPPRTGFAMMGHVDVAVSQTPFAIHAHGRLAILRDDEEPGFEVFHEVTPAGISCASCHPGGLDDGHTWDFGDRDPKRTQPLAIGGLSNTAPFHWAGDLANMRVLMVDTFERLMAGRKLSRREIEALALWLDRLEAPPGVPQDPVLVDDGRALFHRADLGCATCHSGPTLTDNLNHDVGTGEVLQTPSLVGVGTRVPLMHDGCAATIEERFGPCGGGDSHGRTSELDASGIAALSAFLRTL